MNQSNHDTGLFNYMYACVCVCVCLFWVIEG